MGILNIHRRPRSKYGKRLKDLYEKLAVESILEARKRKKKWIDVERAEELDKIKKRMDEEENKDMVDYISKDRAGSASGRGHSLPQVIPLGAREDLRLQCAPPGTPMSSIDPGPALADRSRARARSSPSSAPGIGVEGGESGARVPLWRITFGRGIRSH